MDRKDQDWGDAPASTHKDKSAQAAGLPAAEDGDVLVARSVTINRSRHELYDFWRDFRNLPLFMENIESVALIDADRSHWRVKGPADSTLEWDSMLTEDIPGEVLAWTSVQGADVPNTGRIEFRDSSNGRGTIVTATIAYEPPASKLGELIAKLFGREPKIQARRDLRRFKQLMETGEIPTSAPPEAAPRSE
ncbi:MAG TPA: SRPBCC family protein [Steroidobacteraceae bacterium]|nr:SRPBCC family protein [Steroidobacteraceae bacterium]